MLQRNLNAIVLGIGLDFISILTALGIASLLRRTVAIGPMLPGVESFPTLIAICIVLIWQGILFLRNVYAPHQTMTMPQEVSEVIGASLISLLMLAGLLYFSYRDVSRYLVGYFYVTCLVLHLGWRGVYFALRKLTHQRSTATRRVLIVGRNEIGEEIAGMLKGLTWNGLRVVGFAADPDPISPSDPTPQSNLKQTAGKIESSRAGFPPPRLETLGAIADIIQLVKKHHVQEVVIALPGSAYDAIQQIVRDLDSLPVQVRIVPDYFKMALHHAEIETLGDVPLISLREPALGGYQRLQKRLLDLVITVPMILVSLPIMALISLLVKLSSEGGIIYRSWRVGENGKLFPMYKFRTMVVGADKNYSGVKQRDDNRVTPLGKFLRSSSLDELPQLFNILKGDMSLVGPRPELPDMVDLYEPWQRKRFAVPQGLTGWWQINGRSDKPMHLHTEDDLYYIHHYSLLFDLQILLRTILVVFTRKGAY